ncbi:hypothetical protein FQZ97_416450 [compost metagenome]
MLKTYTNVSSISVSQAPEEVRSLIAPPSDEVELAASAIELAFIFISYCFKLFFKLGRETLELASRYETQD